MGAGGGYENMSELADDEGNIILDSPDTQEDEEESEPEVEAQSEGTPRDETAAGPSTEQPETSTSSNHAETTTETTQSIGGQTVEAKPDASLVKDLATRPTPGTNLPNTNYPYAMRRASWNDEREGNLKFVLRQATQDMEDLAAEEVMEELYPNTKITRTDLREAAFVVGLRNLDEVVDVLNEWGFEELEQARK